MLEENTSNVADMFDSPHERFLEHYRHPQNRQILIDPDAVGFVESASGATLTVYLRLDPKGVTDIGESLIQRISFQSQRCGIAVAYASLLTEIVQGQRIAFAHNLRPEDLMKRFGKGAGALESAALAIQALQKALEAVAPTPLDVEDDQGNS